MQANRWKELLWQLTEARATEIIRMAEQFHGLAETGFCEYATHRRLEQALEGLPGLVLRKGMAVTGLIASFSHRRPGRRVAVTADMDAIHEGHLCGHHMQLSALAAAAQIWAESHIWQELQGEVHFFACPAEEFQDIEFRRELQQRGEILGLSGKLDYLSRGLFAGMDAVLSVHLADDLPQRQVVLGAQTEGFFLLQLSCTSQNARFRTWQNLSRLLQKWGKDVESEGKWRFRFNGKEGRERELLFDCYFFSETWDTAEREKILHALYRRLKEAEIDGATVHCFPGYAPLVQNERLTNMAAQQVRAIPGEHALLYRPRVQGATDLGNVSQQIPTIQLLIGGTRGFTHSRDFRVVDPWMAYVYPVHWLLGMLVDLLAGNP